MDLVVRRARVNGELMDLGIENNVIKIITPAAIEQKGLQEIDAGGKLLSAPLADTHLHLDYVLTAGEPEWNQTGTLLEGIAVWNKRKKTLSYDDVKRRAKRALLWEVAQGVQYIRSHADVCDPDLTSVKALLDLREEMKELVHLQVVAFPQEGILTFPGGQELMTEAVKLGCDVVGGIPHFEMTTEDGMKELDFVFDLAQKYDKLIDVHCDETDDDHSRFVEYMAALTIKNSLQGRVTASHTTAMHSYNNAYAFKLFGWLQKAELNITVNPLDNIVLQGRFDSYPVRRGFTRVKELNEAGINISMGHDSIMDPWYQMGKGSMLFAASMALHVAHMTGPRQMLEIYKMITTNSALTMKVSSEYGVEVGKPANFIILNASDPIEALRLDTECLYSVRNGRIISSTKSAERQVYFDGTIEQISLAKEE